MPASALNEPVLVLNVNYEPLNVCNTKRAFALLFADKADMIINGRGMLKSGQDEFEIPSVIRLRYLVRRPRPRVTLSKREILRRDDYRCQYCGRTTGSMTIDHIKPRWMGGEHSWENLVTACATCNRRKGGKLLSRSNMSLKTKPREPSPSAEYRFGRYLIGREEWRQFIKGW